MTASSSALGLVGWCALCVAGGATVGALTGGGGSAWYAALVRPAWTPPPWVFGPVWTALYATMGLAAWLVWRRGGWPAHRIALTVFLIQLAVNFSWSFVFFTWRRITWALATIVVLWVLIAVTIVLFGRADRRAGWLLVPYFAWVSFAAALNAAIDRMN